MRTLMNDLPTRFWVKIGALCLTAIATGTLMMALTSETAAVVVAIVACLVALSAWEYWRWRSKRPG